MKVDWARRNTLMRLHFADELILVIVNRLFGNKLDWPNMQNMTLLSKQELFDLADGFTIVSFEEEHYQQDNFGQHAFSIILKK